MEKSKKSVIGVITSMVFFGAIGLVRKNIDMPSACLSMVRGIIGGLALLLFVLCKKKSFSLKGLGKAGLLLFISGGLIGLNWVALFESYRYTTVATATLCYYMAPVFLIIVSPFLFKEKLGIRKILCVIVALVGMAFVSDIVNLRFNFSGDFKGILLGLLAALLYATVIIMNKYLSHIDSYVKTVIQLLCAGIVVMPYTFLIEDLSSVSINSKNILWLLIICIVQTGISYILYFGSIPHIPVQTSAILSYIDPVVAVILSTLVLKEPITPLGIVGAVMIIGAMVVSEINIKSKVN